VANPRNVSSSITTMMMAIVSPRRLVLGRYGVGSRLIIRSFYESASN